MSFGTKLALGAICLIALAITLVVSLFSALVALVPLAVAIVPALILIARARRRRLIDQGRDLDELPASLESNEYYRRELVRRGRIVDDRVV